MKVKINLPAPCMDRVRDEHQTMADEILLVNKEIEKVTDKFLKYHEASQRRLNSNKISDAHVELCEQCTNAIVELTTLLEMIGCCERDRNAWRAFVNTKNRKKGYHHTKHYCYELTESEN